MKVGINKKIVCFGALFVSCIASGSPHINVYAGAGMMDAVNKLIEVYQENRDITITPVYASSSSNARQIEKGAPADIYISANKKWIDYLINKQLVDKANTSVVARNELVLIAPSFIQVNDFEPANMSSWRKILQNSKLAIGQPNAVPVGIYARQALSKLGVWSDLQDMTAHTNTVRSVLNLVERREAMMGIVFHTDALISDDVVVLKTFPADSHKPITFIMAQVTNKQDSKGFADFVLSDRGQAIWSSFGFLPANK